VGVLDSRFRGKDGREVFRISATCILKKASDEGLGKFTRR
jgi:hypothetical protein